MITEWKLLEEFQDQNLQIVRQSPKYMVASLVIQPTILQKIGEAQKKDYRLMRMVEDEEMRKKERHVGEFDFTSDRVVSPK